jgi:hypothetical protein
MKVICKDMMQKLKGIGPEGRATGTVSADIDALLSPKSYEELEKLEKQIRAKLRSNEPIDVDYWEQLLRSLIVWKARAKLKKVYQSVIDSRLEGLRKQQLEEAESIRTRLQEILKPPTLVTGEDMAENQHDIQPSRHVRAKEPFKYSRDFDPEPFLKLRPEDKALESSDEKAFLQKIVSVLKTLPHAPRQAILKTKLHLVLDHVELTSINRLPNGTRC